MCPALFSLSLAYRLVGYLDIGRYSLAFTSGGFFADAVLYRPSLIRNRETDLTFVKRLAIG